MIPMGYVILYRDRFHGCFCMGFSENINEHGHDRRQIRGYGPEGETKMSGNKATILVADDDPDIAELGRSIWRERAFVYLRRVMGRKHYRYLAGRKLIWPF